MATVPDCKLRMTRQRQIILEVLRKVKTHPTADEVYEMVRRKISHVSLSTIYRNLEILSACGMIHKIELGGAQRRFDGDPTGHYHVRCIQCGRVEDVPVSPASELDDALRKVSEYEVFGHRLEFIGVCPQCRREVGGAMGREMTSERRRTPMVATATSKHFSEG